MGSLANKKIGDSFKDLLQISNNNSGIDGSVRFITDGEGTQSVLGLDTSKITIDGHILPTTNAAFDIGNASNKIRHLYLSDNSLFVGDVRLSSTDAANVKSLDDGTYATTAAMNAGMATKADTAALNDFATTAAMNAGMDTKADASALSDYATTAAMNTKADASALSDYATTAAMNAGMATKADTIALADYATTADMNSSIQSIIGSAPEALNTLDEISNALGDDGNYAATITNALASKANQSDVDAAIATKADVSVMLSTLLQHPTHVDLSNGLALKANATDLATYSLINHTHDGYLSSSASDVFAGKFSVSSTTLRSAGMYGIYDSYKTGHIWSMGTDYSIPNTGDDFGNLYGFGYKHINNITGGEMAGSHQGVWCINGTPYAALGTNIWAKNNIIAFSDARVKKNIETIPNALDKIKAIRGVTYERTDSDVDGKQMGVIAQELVDVVPEVVAGGPTDDDPDGYYSVAYGNMVGLLIEAIKEQQEQLEEQKQLINQLINR